MSHPAHEPVYVFAEWCDGPRSGLAAFRGRPHLYESLWRDDEDDPDDDWALIPVDPAAVSDLLTQLCPAVHDADAPTLYPGLCRPRKLFTDTWRAFKSTILAADGDAVRAVGDMRPVGNQPPRDDGFDPLEVCWTVRGVVSIASVRERLAELERMRAASRPPDVPPAGDEMPF